MNYSPEIENGTVDPSLPNYATKYSIRTADVLDTVPGSVTSQNMNEGISLLRMDLTAPVTIYIDKDWTNRKSVSTQNQIVIKRGNISKTFDFVKVYPTTVNSSPATKIVLTNTVSAEEMFDFVGATGSPGASASVFLSLDPQNLFQDNDLSSNLTLVKGIQSHSTSEFTATFSWENSSDVKFNAIRWRAVPVISRKTFLSFTVDYAGQYTVLPKISLSSFGAGENLELVGTVESVEVISGGEYVGTPFVTVSYPGASGASFSVGMTGSSIESVAVVSGGIGYNTSPTFTISGATAIENAELLVYVKIDSVKILAEGYDYVDAPSVFLTGGSGSGGTVSASTQVINDGRVDYIEIATGGTGYATSDLLVFSGGGGTGASAKVNTTSGEITSVTVLSNGYGYTSEPSVAVSSGGTGADLRAVVSMYSDWNYIDVDPISPTLTLYNLKKDLEYEWQLYSSTEKKQGFVSYSPVNKFKFF